MRNRQTPTIEKASAAQPDGAGRPGWQNLTRILAALPVLEDLVSAGMDANSSRAALTRFNAASFICR